MPDLVGNPEDRFSYNEAHFFSGTLDNMVQKLQQYRNMTFQWVETVFLERWFRDISKDTKIVVGSYIRCLAF